MSVDFIMTHLGGSEMHVHNFTNIASNRTIATQGNNVTITGKTASIAVGVSTTDNHFQGQPIYGLVKQMTGGNSTTAG